MHTYSETLNSSHGTPPPTQVPISCTSRYVVLKSFVSFAFILSLIRLWHICELDADGMVFCQLLSSCRLPQVPHQYKFGHSAWKFWSSRTNRNKWITGLVVAKVACTRVYIYNGNIVFSFRWHNNKGGLEVSGTKVEAKEIWTYCKDIIGTLRDLTDVDQWSCGC